MSQSSDMSWNGSSGNTGIRYRAPRPGNSASPVTAPDSSAARPRDGSRIPAWGRSATSGSYLTVGSIRYGVRLAGGAAVREEVPSRGDAVNQHGDGDCCCGVVQLLSPSRIPLPADKTPAINRRGIFSRINSGESVRGPAVYRSSLEWPRATEDAPSRPARRRVLVRPKPDIPAYLKLCNSASASSDSETSNLLTPTDSNPGSRDNLAEEGDHPRRNTLDRLQRFRLGGGGNKKEGGKKKPPRSSDKTESLRELTERLKGNSSSPDLRKKSSSPVTGPRESSVNKEAAAAVGGSHDVTETAEGGRAMDEEERAPDSVKEDDLFECVNLRLPKPESKTIVGSYIQRTIPFRSASFSKVDFSSADGKYIRSSMKSSPYSGFSTCGGSGTLPLSSSSVIAGGSLTLPRKRLPDVSASTSVSPSSSTTLGVEEPTGSTPSVDSAVGSDEGFLTSVVHKIPTVGKTPDSGTTYETSHKPPGSRSLTYPLPRRGSRPDEDIPFSSIDGNGLKSLSYAPVQPSSGRELLQEVAEESETPPSDSIVVCDIACEHLPGADDQPDGSNETEVASQYAADENVIDPSLSSVGSGSCEPCQKPEPSHSSAEAESSSATIVDQCSISQIERDINQLQDEIRSECAEIEEYQCVNTREVSAEPTGGSDQKSSEGVSENSANHETLCSDSSLCGKKESGSEFTTEKTGESVNETEKRSSQLISEESSANVDEDRQPEYDVKIWVAQTNRVCEDVTNQEDACLSIQVPQGQSISFNEKDKGIDHSLNYAQETELLNPWQEAKPAEDCESQPAMVKSKENSSPAAWQDSGGQQRWSGEGTSNEWGSPHEESHSPDESHAKQEWPKKSERELQRFPERPRLVCQSSEERDDEVGSRPSPRRYQLLARTDSLSEGESDQGERVVTPLRDRTASPSFLSDSEGRSGGTARSPHTPRRYSKRPLRGPYGQMLEAEMKKPETNRMFSKLQYNEELKFLEEYTTSPPPQRPSSPNRTSSNPGRPRALTTQSLDDSQLKGGYGRASPKRKVSVTIPTSTRVVSHQRTTSSPSQLEGYATARREDSPRLEPSPELLAELLRGSSERLFVPNNATLNGSSVHHWKDTRTHVVVELFETERSYVESLQILVMKYLKPLKSPENAGLVDAALVDEIFFQVPAILSHHEVFLEELRKRLDSWDIKQTVGDVFLEAFTKQPVIETYTSFINNWKTAKEAIKSTCQAKPAFARFLEAMAREHKGKLDLDSLLIMPVQRVPRYELLIQTLLKHTDPAHPDHQLLMDAQKEVHELAVKINCTERETLEFEQQQQTLKELEALIEGLINLVHSERTFLRHDLVTMASGQGTRKERALFLFSDLMVITSIKRRSGTIRKPSTSCPGSVASTLEGNKYKLLMRIPLDDLEIVKAKDENLRRMMREMENLAEDVATLNQINDLTAMLHCPHSQLEDVVRDMLGTVSKQLLERQNSDSQLSYLELTLNTQNGIENISVVFTKPEKKTSWEESFNEAKQKLALSADRRPSPEFLSPLPIRKTRAGLQFTCAAPTLGLNAYNMRDVWVCNSDGYVGQVCVLSLQPEPTVISCNGVCNARILCIASIPTNVTGPVSCSSSVSGSFTNSKAGISISVEDTDEGGGNIQLDSSSSSDEEDEPDEEPPATSQGEEEQKRVRSASDSLMNEPGLLEDPDSLQPTMWLGTEDGCIHVYNCSDNIRIKKNKVKIQHGSSVHCIIYLDNRVFVSLANGDITVYVRDQNGGWNTTDPYTVSVGTAATPVTRMLPITGKLWCGCHNSIKILNTTTLEVEHSFQVNADCSRAVTCMAASGFGVWVSQQNPPQQNSAIVKLFHATTYDYLCEVNVAPAVTKMLASCDDIIRQHKAACLRVTSLLACKDLLWIGTSAGVVLTMPLPHISASTTKLGSIPNPTGVPHGHTGHVRFLTFVETSPASSGDSLVVRPNTHHRYSLKNKPELGGGSGKLLVISGGDGYEDFRTSSVSEVAGREDSTNHLLLWHV